MLLMDDPFSMPVRSRNSADAGAVVTDDGERSSPDAAARALVRRAMTVADAATRYLARHFGPRFDECASVGVLGSLARGAPTETSDVDYYVVFHTASMDAVGLGTGNDELS